MKIPKYSEIDPEIRKIDLDDLFDLLMCDLATHSIHDALCDMVIFVKKGKVDLSKELIELAHHPKSLSIPVSIANKMCYLQTKRFKSRVKDVLKGGSDSSPKVPKSDKSYDDAVDDSKSHYFENRLIDYIKNNSLVGLNIVAVDKDGGLLDVGLNDPRAVGNVVLGFEDLKLQILNHLGGASHYSGSGGSLPGPDKPSSTDPIDQASDFLRNIGY